MGGFGAAHSTPQERGAERSNEPQKEVEFTCRCERPSIVVQVVILWMGRSYFITSKFSGYDMSWSLLLTTISRLCTTWSSSRASCAVVISYWLPHFQPPSYSRVANSTICIILYKFLLCHHKILLY